MTADRKAARQNFRYVTRTKTHPEGVPYSSAKDTMWQEHTGGQGLIVVATIISENGESLCSGMFSSILKAELWAESHFPGEVAIFSPEVVDHPRYMPYAVQ
jgi:hypothetical protein